MKLIEVTNLQKILPSFLEKEMPIRLSYKITKLSVAIQTENEFFITKLREIVNKYAEKDEQGNPIQQENGNILIQKDFIDLANKEVDALNNLEVTLPDISFTLDELDTLDVKPSDLMALLPFIKED